MTNFNDLPNDLLLMIATRLKKINDFRSFTAVSKSLSVAVSDKDYFEGLPLWEGIPYLFLPVRDDFDDHHDDSDYDADNIDDFFKVDLREFYSLFEGESIVASLRLPGFKTKKCYESLGWLLVVGNDGNMNLLDPFSSIQFSLPHLNTFPEFNRCVGIRNLEHEYIRKMVLSSRPTETHSNFIMMVITRFHKDLAIWRLGDEAWTMINDFRAEGLEYMDVVYGGGDRFYAITLSGVVKVFNFSGNGMSTMTINSGNTLNVRVHGSVYILKTPNDSLLIITRIADDWYCRATKKFKVYEVDISTGTWKESHSLGSMALFLGNNSSIVVDASKICGGVIKANCIYFTGGSGAMKYPGTFISDLGSDNGVYNMERRAIKPICAEKVTSSLDSPPLWITPSFHKES